MSHPCRARASAISRPSRRPAPVTSAAREAEEVDEAFIGAYIRDSAVYGLHRAKVHSHLAKPGVHTLLRPTTPTSPIPTRQAASYNAGMSAPPSRSDQPSPPVQLRPDHGSALAHATGDEIQAAGGWLSFERFMELALYAPGMGYYSGGRRVLGQGPQDGSDFVTAPELSPVFGLTLARQIEQALEATGTDEVWEFGAGSGALAVQLLSALGGRVKRYT